MTIMTLNSFQENQLCCYFISFFGIKFFCVPIMTCVVAMRYETG